MKRLCLSILMVANVSWAGSLAFDFESGTLEGWTVTEGNFPGLVSGRSNRFHDSAPLLKNGKWNLSTLDSAEGKPNDAFVGVVESPEFTLANGDVRLRVAGGSASDVFLALCSAVDGKEILFARGANSQDFLAVAWNVPSEWIGKPLFFRLVDRSKGGWGHLLVDDIRFEGTLVPAAQSHGKERKALAGQGTPSPNTGVGAESAVTTLSNLRGEVRPAALRAMIEDLRNTQGTRFPKAGEFLAGLKKVEERCGRIDGFLSGKGAGASLVEMKEWMEEAQSFQREVARANPLVTAAPIVYVVRAQYAKDHHNTENLFQTGEPNCRSYVPGGPLKVLDVATGKSQVLLDPGSNGLVRDPEVHFDGKKILVSWRKAAAENYSIHEFEVDGTALPGMKPGSLRRLTAQPEATDFDPMYLPDGKILFSSTREPKYCHCNMHIMGNLHRMDGDGANIHQISKNTLFDGHPTLLSDGRILYDRWEYVDRNFGDAQGLWTVNPDGTSHALYWKNNMVSPAGAFDARVIPGTETVVSIVGSCHDQAWGSLAIVDRSKGLDRPESILRVWPEDRRERFSAEGSEIGRVCSVDEMSRGLRVRYEDPFPLVDPATGKGGKYFLVSRSVNPFVKGPGELRMALYLVDSFGNEILLHEEGAGCFDPMPLVARAKPRVIPDRRNYTDTEGTMYVSDVYEGTHMKGVKRGDIKWLRVVESTEKRVWTFPSWTTAQWPGAGGAAVRPAISWAGFETKRILGTVPVEADGSAHFKVPSEKFVYFQTLDSNGMLVSTMRSGTMVQPGEMLGCTGCHEDRLSAPPPKALSLALRRGASTLSGWRGETRTVSYLRDVQPVWDKNCVSCHDFGKPAGKRILLSGDKELFFNVSYMELFKNWGRSNALLSTVGLGVAKFNEPYAVGSHQSPLVKLLREGHRGVRLQPEELDRVITWIDVGGPYYPDYASAHPNNPGGRAPIGMKDYNRLLELFPAPANLKGKGISYDNHRFLFNFTRPERSPCLETLAPAGPEYREALGILTRGREELLGNPEPDQPGFKPCAEHAAREEKYQRLLAQEQARRKAIAEGRKIYDEGIGKP